MTLSDLAGIATVISSVAVLASLIYLALQTRQNVRHTKALLWQSTAERTIAFCLGMADPELVKPFLAAHGTEPTPEAIGTQQVYLQNFALLIQCSEMFTQRQDGLVDDERFNFLRAQLVAQWAASPVIRTFMEENLSLISPDSKLRRSLLEVVADAKARAVP